MALPLPDVLFEISGQGLSPDKDFYHLAITKSYVTWRWWKISLRHDGRNTKPGELKQSHQDYLDDDQLQSQVSMVFGNRIRQYTLALCQGHYDYLERLPDPLLLRILAHLELEDVRQLGRTSRRFWKLCGSEAFWQQTVRRCCDTISPEVSALAMDVGWRSIFFTSKLQVQKQISRWRQRAKQQEEEEEEEEEGVVCCPEAKGKGLLPQTEPPGEDLETGSKPCC
ncbi:F-box only protein 36b [Lampris incognitus]|uniref:F-box only protein 36b n=1 Tax=Lampris incognitus TaxID=2546036 RepID=UPI0024B536CE|nr:F-box only protein 36b [Lampris incognitus]